MTREEFTKATEFAQSVINSNPRDQLEDHWVEFSDTIDINIWFDESPIYATAYPIRVDENGYKYTDTSHVFATLNVTENVEYNVYEDKDGHSCGTTDEESKRSQ